MTNLPLPPEAVANYVLRMGDTCLILGHRMSELMGHAPVLEEDLSIANIALELVDQARAWLTLAGQLEGNGRDEDQLAYHRDENEFFSATLAEQPNGNFADTVARQLLLSAWQKAWYQQAANTARDDIQSLAQRFLPQTEFHFRWARDWTVRLGDGTALSKTKMQQAVDGLWKYTGELFESDALDSAASTAQLGPEPESLHEPWQRDITATLDEATLMTPQGRGIRWHGKKGEHGEELGRLLAEMQSLARAHPGVKW